MTPRLRIRIVHVALAVFAVLLIGKAAQVQLFQGDDWANLAERQQVLASSLPAPRGPIMDANGEILAESRETLALAVAPPEVHDLKVLRRALQQAGVSPAVVRRATNARNKWVELPRRFLPEQAAPLLAIRGVHGSPWVERVSPTAEGTRRIVGILDGKGKPVDGIELALDSVLRGQQGRTRYLKDAARPQLRVAGRGDRGGATRQHRRADAQPCVAGHRRDGAEGGGGEERRDGRGHRGARPARR